MDYKKVLFDYLCSQGEISGMIAAQLIFEEQNINLDIDQIRAIVYKLRDEGLITVQDGKDGPRICLTGNGKNKCNETK